MRQEQPPRVPKSIWPLRVFQVIDKSDKLFLFCWVDAIISAIKTIIEWADTLVVLLIVSIIRVL